MENKTEIINRYDELKREIEILKEEYLEKVCPFKVGDIVIIKGYSYKGKKGIVQKITTYRYWEYRLMWQVSGNVLKKDDSIGNNWFEMTEDEYGK